MTIKEAIKFIISKNDNSLLLDLKRFNAHLKDLCTTQNQEQNQELNILQYGLTDKILKLFFEDDRPKESRIANVRRILEDKGLAEDRIDSIIDSFCSALGWKIENKEEQKVTEKNFVNKEINVEEAEKQVEEAKKQLEKAQKIKIDEAHSKTKEAEKKFKEVERKFTSLKIDLENANKREKELQSKYDKITAECSKTEKEYEKAKAVYENLKLRYENVNSECKLISKELIDIQVKSKDLSKRYKETKNKVDEAKTNFEKLNLEELILQANYGDVEAQKNLGNIYYNGKGVKQDYLEAFNWYKKSAEKGNPTAQYNLAIMYLTGQGIEKNKEEANKWLQKSADLGDEDAKKILSKEKSQNSDNVNNPFLNNSSNFSDIWASVFNPKKEQTIELTLEEAKFGTLKTIQISETCEVCNGSGWISSTLICSNCHGLGHMNKVISVEVKIPAGVKDGKKIRVKNNILIVKII